MKGEQFYKLGTYTILQSGMGKVGCILAKHEAGIMFSPVTEDPTNVVISEG